MRTYIKIYGPPLIDSIKALEFISVDMPEICIMNVLVSGNISDHIAQDIGVNPSPVRVQQTDPVTGWTMNYFKASKIEVPAERCFSIISKSGESLGEYDFFFEWFKKPTMEQIENLLQRVDDALTPLGCLYTATTKQ
jgi:hypothetical protein